MLQISVVSFLGTVNQISRFQELGFAKLVFDKSTRTLRFTPTRKRPKNGFAYVNGSCVALGEAVRFAQIVEVVNRGLRPDETENPQERIMRIRKFYG